MQYVPVHLQPHSRRLGFGPGVIPEAERYCREVITLLLFSALTDDEGDASSLR